MRFVLTIGHPYIRANAPQQTLLTKIKERTRRKAALSDRKSAAAQARMKSIANLAADERVPKKRRKAGGGAHSHSYSLPSGSHESVAEDMFGADDADWAIYRKIVRVW